MFVCKRPKISKKEAEEDPFEKQQHICQNPKCVENFWSNIC